MKIDKKSIVESSGAETNSDAANDLERDLTIAENALATANCQELFDLYKKAVKECGDAVRMMAQLSKHFIGSKEAPMFQPNGNVIQCMERVSLAAIQLARDTVGRDKKS